MKLSWLCINQCHMYGERWGVLSWNVLKPLHDSKPAGGAFKYDALGDRSCAFKQLLYVFVNPRWANSKRCPKGWKPNLSIFLSVNMSKHLYAHCLSLLWGSSGCGCAEETQEEVVANDCVFTQWHTQQDHWFHGHGYPLYTKLTPCHWTGTISTYTWPDSLYYSWPVPLLHHRRGLS